MGGFANKWKDTKQHEGAIGKTLSTPIFPQVDEAFIGLLGMHWSELQL